MKNKDIKNLKIEKILTIKNLDKIDKDHNKVLNQMSILMKNPSQHYDSKLLINIIIYYKKIFIIIFIKTIFIKIS